MKPDDQLKSHEDFEALVKEHQKSIYRLCLKITGTEEDANEATQMTFVRAYKGISAFRKASAFRTWLIRIAINCSRTLLKQRIKRQGRDHDKDISDIKIETNNNLDQQIEEKEKRQLLLTALNKLPEKQRLVVSLRIMEDMSFKEISEVLKMREGSAKTNFHHAVSTLKTILGEKNES